MDTVRFANNYYFFFDRLYLEKEGLEILLLILDRLFLFIYFQLRNDMRGGGVLGSNSFILSFLYKPNYIIACFKIPNTR